MDEMTKHRKRRLQALVDGPPYRGSQRALSKAADVTEGRLTQMLSPEEPFGERAARNLVEKLGLPDRYFESEFTLDATTLLQAHSLSLVETNVDPQTVTWEWILSAKKEQLPWRFMVLMPDASLSGKAEKGDELVFEVGYPPRIGKLVLVEQKATGRRFVRLYAEGAKGWRAIATSTVFLSFENGEEEADILATVRWRE